MFSNLAKLLPVGKVPTLPDVLNFAMLAKLLFQRCFVQKVKLCQTTRLSQRMAQKRPPACGETLSVSLRSTALPKGELFDSAAKLPATEKAPPFGGAGKSEGFD